VLLLASLAACHQVFRLDELRDDARAVDDADRVKEDAGIDAALACMRDPFDTFAQWSTYAPQGCTLMANGTATLTIASNATCYTDLTSVTARKLVGATITVKVPMVPASDPNVETYFELVVAGKDDLVYFVVNNGSLYMYVRVAGTEEQEKVIPFSESAMPYWRFQYTASADGFDLYTGTGEPNGWTLRHTVRLPSHADAMDIALGTGAYNLGTPTASVTQFDDFEVCTPR
jgi:hypothetical protein